MMAPLDQETLLNRFRSWLRDANESTEIDDEPNPTDDDNKGIGLYRLVEEFTALRQEIKLQTKGTRGLQEQAEALLPALRQAMEHFRSVEPREAQAVWSAGKTMAEALADLDEALVRGRAQIEKSRRQLVDEPSAKLIEALDARHASQGWFARRRTQSYHQAARELILQHGPESNRPFFDALLEGYGLIQSRLARVMNAEQIQRIETVGRPVDPERMTVIEIVDDSGRPPGSVVDETRSGYTWRGRVLRYAEVRAARSSAPLPDESNESDQEPDPEFLGQDDQLGA